MKTDHFAKFRKGGVPRVLGVPGVLASDTPSGSNGSEGHTLGTFPPKAEHGGVPDLREHPAREHGVLAGTQEIRGLQQDWNTGTPGTPDPDRWLHEYEERAAIREHEGGQSRPEAERFAYEETLLAWHREHGMPPDGVCGACGHPLDGWHVPMPDRSTVHAHCVADYGTRWRARAAEALTLAGIPAPNR